MAALGVFDGRFQRRVELIRGEIVEMSPIGSRHAHVLALLAEWSYRAVPADRCMVRIQSPIRIASIESEPEPDLVWVDRKAYARRHPEPSEVRLVIEVADSSLEYDRTRKLAVYDAAGIAEYWIVNLIDDQLEIHRDPVDSAYSSLAVVRDQQAARPLCGACSDLTMNNLLEF